MGEACFGRHQQPTCVFVEPVDNARSPDTAYSLQTFAAMGDQGIYQSACLISWCRMDNQACGFVYNDKLFVLEYYVERNVFASQLEVSYFGYTKNKFFAQFDPVGWLYYRSRHSIVHCQVALLDKTLYEGSRSVRKTVSNKSVDPLALSPGWHRNGETPY